jgi:tRNA nucleotidyltransferase (CCA-adding enzyme)
MGRGKIVIDIEKQFKNKNQVLMDLNASKLNSPIILVDPTFKHRNVLAALSEETFKRFQKIAGNFLKNPNISFFVPHKSNLEKIEKNSVKKGFEFQQLILETDKQRGGIAGSKLKKFYLHLGKEVGKFFDLKDSGFEYSGKKDAICFFVAKKKNGLLIMGPKISQKESVKKFKKAHNKTFSKNGRIYVKKKINFNLRQFLEKWIDKNKKKVKDMSVDVVKVI